MATIALRPLPNPLGDPGDLPPETTRIVVADEPHSYPCRRCLRDAEPGERLVLLSYDPFTGDSPYRQAGPIYVHAGPCAPHPHGPGHELPDQLTRRQLSVRGFDRDHSMTNAAVVPGTALSEAADRLFEDPAVAYLHVHNAGAGCFAVRIDRGAAAG